MSESPALPEADAVARMLRDLFGKNVTQKTAVAMPAATKVYVATYIDPEDSVVAVCACDLPLGTSMGAALALIPAGAAAEALRAGKLPAEMLDNLREVLNIGAALFVGLRLRLREVLPPGDPLPAPVAALVSKPRLRRDLELAVPGYSGGRLFFAIG